MPRPAHVHLRSVTLICVLTLTACIAAPGPPTEAAPAVAADTASSREILQTLRAAIGQAPCTSDAQCHSVAIGSRPCGGPEGYLAWSDQTADSQRIAQLATHHSAARKAENARTGIASDCRYRPDPGAVCRPQIAGAQKLCQPGGGGRSGAV